MRGVVATDALIGTFASMDDPSLIQNRCFLYHLIGNGTGEWRVPVGGMGAVTDALAKAAVDAGAEILTGAGVSADHAPAPTAPRSPGTTAAGEHSVTRDAACWPASRRGCCGSCSARARTPSTKPAGLAAQDQPPARPAAARSGPASTPRSPSPGTLHLAEDYTQLEHGVRRRCRRPRCPTRCRARSTATASPTPRSWATGRARHAHADLLRPAHPGRRSSTPTRRRASVAVQRALASLDARLAEPIADCLATDADGQPCIEAKIPQDIERDLAMPGGHIFHGDLEWPWASNRARLDTPAQQWGVQTDARRRAALRLRRAPRRRRLRARRAQRRPGGPRRSLTGARLSRRRAAWSPSGHAAPK